jgi:hypothetical protein
VFRLMRPHSTVPLIGAMVLALAACGEMVTLPISAGRWVWRVSSR